MPAHLVLHEGDTLALDGVGQDALGLAGDGGGAEVRGILLFCEMIKEHRASQGSCRKIRMPGANLAA